ncbi:putative retroelement pol polyprotein [Trifolium pratense]|uniref:Putative retroelement pol polyprotein n=1 Tax=Trifolium pratense TaxID=57577 RepID=A0A2K3N9P3_TRIPR|nr:putative retroelement pol polyprotein [Trifolium pratense]
MSSAYHPQSDGQTEIVNKVLQQYLRCFVHDKPTQWGKFIHWAEWHYNTAIHTSTGLSPFQVVYGRAPPTLVDYIPGSTTLQAVEATELERTEVLQILKKKLLKAQATMKEQADQKRIAHQFKVGDKVFVRLRPYRQNSVEGRRVQKLAKRYYGPFKLVNAIGDVAFQLELPPSSRIHPVFHVSQLKPCFDDSMPSLDLPLETVGNLPIIRPLAVLDWEYFNGEPARVLVQWEGLFPEDATWEEYQFIRDTYPEFNLEDKVGLDEPRDVMNEVQEQISDEEEQVARPKRNIVQPNHLKDFVVPSLKKKSRKN